ncbi:tight adherance operon protein, partial [Escherichia coli]|nr:tight adherance operon protein [Escherichia coli]
VRIVHTMVEIIDALNRIQPTPRRLILCLSDSRPVTLGMLSIDDLQSLLERRLDIVFPYNKAGSSFAIRKQLPPVDLLAMQVLGASAPQKKGFIKHLSFKRER